MATVTILIRDTDDGQSISVATDFVGGFDAESEAHALAADLTTQLAQEDNKND